MTTHTQGPWLCDKRTVYALNKKGFNIFSAVVQDCRTSNSEMEENARRIVACVNACAGISTENLEDNLPVKELADRYNALQKHCDGFAEQAAFQRDARLGALKELAKVEGQRNELLTALEEAIEYLEPRVEGGKVGANLLPRLKAVISSVKGGAA